jgi:uncharacterized membrane protein YedE/YeeE
MNELYVRAAVGGLLIGSAAGLLWMTLGRVAGVSGIVGELLSVPQRENAWRAAFVIGLVVGAPLYLAWSNGPRAVTFVTSTAGMAVAGLLVGAGTRLGSGCTSGHGVCGLARISPRSMIATLVFVVSAMMTVFLIRHGVFT